jgi:hypothetical protein
MVLRDEVAHDGGQAVFAGDVDPVRDVVPDDCGARLGARLSCGLVAVEHVLDVVMRLGELADVVVVGAHAGDEGIGADAPGAPLASAPTSMLWW